MKVSEVMNSVVHVCRPDQTLDEAAQIFWGRDCGCVPVVDAEERLVGMLTDRDACLAAFFRGATLKQIQIGTCMASSVVAVGPQESVEDALDLLRAHQLRRLPVIDAERRVLGILSLSDVARAVARGADIKPKRLARTLSAVSEMRSVSSSLVIDIDVKTPAETRATPERTIDLTPRAGKTKPKRAKARPKAKRAKAKTTR